MALFNRDTWPQHRPWAWAALLGTLGAIVLYAWQVEASGPWPTGSTPVGFGLGVVAGGLMLFEWFFGIRKKWFRTWRIFGRAKVWTVAHIWLGILLIPVAILHSGFYLGGTLSAALMVLFLIVSASGLVGISLQQTMPTRMLERAPGETVYSQIDRICGYLRRDAERLMRAVRPEFAFPPVHGGSPHGGLAEDGRALPVQDAAATRRANTAGAMDAADGNGRAGAGHGSNGAAARYVGVGGPANAARDDGGGGLATRVPVLSGAVRAVGRFRGVVPKAAPRAAMVLEADAAPLERFVAAEVEPFLHPDADFTLPLADSARAGGMFNEIRKTCAGELRPTVEALRGLCDHRRDLLRQGRIHRLLHGWLLVHLPLSVASVVLLIAHAVLAVRYW